MAEAELAPSTVASVVLDIGGDVGALVLHAAAERFGDEIDLNPDDPARPHTHSAVRERRVGSQRRYAAVYPELLKGSYTLAGSGQRVTIEGGRITELTYEPAK
ncbi:MAG TPA: hypothetical protein VNF07_12545 [Acidimicrobiales bacterium]|nr:hypothetical protein [Acidimicrobiales bacterium]